MQKKQLTPEQAVQKLRQYCAYQERCHYEVEQKLWTLGIRKNEHAGIIASLIEDNYLNEERFAIQYAGGKFRMNHWGRRKIVHALREKKVSEYSIKRALKQISQEEYEKTIRGLAEKKYSQLKGEPAPVLRKKISDYLVQKGFEHELVNSIALALTRQEQGS